MKMEIKFKREIRLTQEQLNELPSILAEPDMGWEAEYEQHEHTDMKGNVYEVVALGNYGTYTYRVNLSFELITVLEVK